MRDLQNVWSVFTYNVQVQDKVTDTIKCPGAESNMVSQALASGCIVGLLDTLERDSDVHLEAAPAKRKAHSRVGSALCLTGVASS